MFFIILPILVMALATSSIFLIEQPSVLVYSVVVGVDFLMVFAMLRGYLLYIKTSHEVRDRDFAEEITQMVKKIHKNRTQFSREELILQLENINRMVNEYNLARQDIIVEPVNIQDFLQSPNETPQ